MGKLRIMKGKENLRVRCFIILFAAFALIIVLVVGLHIRVMASAKDQTWPVMKVVDGDTLDVQYRPLVPMNERVRLLRVNTPERGKRGYKEAANALHKLINGKKVSIVFEKQGVPVRGGYGRLLAYVFVGKTNVNLELVRLGWSRYWTKYGRGRFASQFELAEKEARSARRGLWTKYGWNKRRPVRKSK